MHELGEIRVLAWRMLAYVYSLRLEFLGHLPAKMARALDVKIFQECRAENNDMDKSVRPRSCHIYFAGDGELRGRVGESIDSSTLVPLVGEYLDDVVKMPLTEEKVKRLTPT